MVHNVMIFVILVLFTSGCLKQTMHQKKAKSESGKHASIKKSSKQQKQGEETLSAGVINVQEFLALHSEIPDTLLDFDVEHIQVDVSAQQGFEVVYKPKRPRAALTHEEIKALYLADMELLGWKLIGQFVADDMQLLFQRPNHALSCMVTLHKNHKISVTVLPK